MNAQTHLSPSRVTPRTVGFAVGVLSVIAGGLLSAITDPLSIEKGSWLAAYLVLITGVAQVILAAQQQLLQAPHDRERAQWATLTAWLLGNAAVITGSLLVAPLIVDIGGLLLIVALLTAWVRLRGTEARLQGLIFQIVYAIIIVSVPIGLVLAHLRA